MKLTKELVLSKCNGFIDTQLWPTSNYLNINSWLSNFNEDEMAYAYCLLNSFVYYSEAMVDRMMQAAFSGLLSHEFGGIGRESTERLRHFWSRMCITHVTGEVPSVTDSGHLFARKARQVLGVNETSILYPEKAIIKLACSEVDYIVFVDDFVGSGDQFYATHTRIYIEGMDISFSSFSERGGAKIYYIPLLATQYGLRRLSQTCPEVTICPANVLPDQFDVFDAASVVWPEELRNGAANFIKNASLRAGYGNGHGIAGLGYQIAFSHGVPDATLPLFWSETNGWKPLIRRT